MTTISPHEWRFEYSFRIAITEGEHTAIVHFCGDFDAHTVAAFRRAVTIPTHREEVILDLTDLQFMDMTGARELRSIERRLQGLSIRTHIHGAHNDLQKVLDICPPKRHAD